MMNVGTGSTIAVCKPRRVNISNELRSSNINYHGVVMIVLYRSKETALPDFSKDETVIGEVFFDVGTLRHHLNDLSKF